MLCTSKKCPHCGASEVIRKGQKRGSSYWYCHACGRYFVGRRKVGQADIQSYYLTGRYTLRQTAQHFGVSLSTVQRRLRDLPVANVAPRQGCDVVLQMDTTYWGRGFAVVIFMDAHSHRVLHLSFIDRHERLEDYQAGISHLQAQGYRIKAIVSDGFQGIKKSFPDIPYQHCQFHKLMRIRHWLTRNPRLQASREFYEIVLGLSSSGRAELEQKLGEWHAKWQAFLSEKTYFESGSWSFTHRRIRSAYYSLKGHLDELFTFESYPELAIPRTNNALEALNASLKMKLRLHHGLSQARKRTLIANLLYAYNPLRQ